MRTALPTAALLLLTACAPSASVVTSAAPIAVAEGVVRLNVGAIEVTSFQDATGQRPNDGTIFAIGEDPAAVRAVLEAAGAPKDSLRVDANVLLVQTGERRVLLDSGSGTAFGSPGRFPERLAAAGVGAEAITDIVISHAHGDHIGGLVTGGRLAFANARIHIAAEEWAALQGQAAQAALVAVIRPRVNAVRRGDRIAPGISTVAVAGHTSGHMATEISSGGQRLLAVGDTVHHYVLSVRKPEWTIRFDSDADTAERSRRALLAAAARERTVLFAPHFPAPGLGRVRVEGDGFAWVPLS